MNERFHSMLRDMRNPVKSRRREALMRLEREWEPEEIGRFCEYVRDLDPASCVDLCAVLADARTPGLVDLLGEYALRPEDFLRRRALAALEGIPGALRVNCLVRLLESPDPAVREQACSLLGVSGSQGPRSDLVLRLEDESAAVIVAALKALEKLDCRDAAHEVKALLGHEDAGVCVQAMEALVALAPGGEFPTRMIVEKLAQGATPDVRTAAAWALGMRPSEEGRLALLRKLETPDEDEVLSAITAALAACRDVTVVRALLTWSARTRRPAVALNCRRALNSLSEEMILGQRIERPRGGLRAAGDRCAARRALAGGRLARAVGAPGDRTGRGGAGGADRGAWQRGPAGVVGPGAQLRGPGACGGLRGAGGAGRAAG